MFCAQSIHLTERNLTASFVDFTVASAFPAYVERTKVVSSLIPICMVQKLCQFIYFGNNTEESIFLPKAGIVGLCSSLGAEVP